ncbi:MAG: DUF2306 domain-containing protein [Terriglobales bacterium]|jgi:predicted membrane protein DUF2306
MAHSPLLILHIGSAIIALLSGWAALFFRKGSRRHRAAGQVFLVSMLSMCGSAVSMAIMKQETPNVIAGVLTFYLVGTAWLTMRRKAGETGLPEFGAMLVALAVGIGTWVLGWQASQSAIHPKDGPPAMIYFVFGLVALLSAAGDARMLIRGGVTGAQRIVRHLWRMCFALFIAQASAFSGKRTEIFPEAIRKTHVLNVLIIAIPLIMIFWLCRVWFTKAPKRRVTAALIQQRSMSTLAYGEPNMKPL